MQDPYENLEVAKLAAALSGQLRRIDKETESSMPANRIDLRKFQQQVVNSANPNAARPVDFGGYQNQDEARMMEFLNREALNKIPDLIPPPNFQPPPVNIPAPVNIQPQVPEVPQVLEVQQQLTESPKINLPVVNQEITEELVKAVKGIDDSLKQLCDFFINDSFKKKEKKLIPVLKNKKLVKKKTIASNIPNPLETVQIYTMSQEEESRLLSEINTHQKNLQNVQ